ncbi:MAG: tRNA epoxyqueuosine(34) reductase QueG [Luteibaculaceae bacterium]
MSHSTKNLAQNNTKQVKDLAKAMGFMYCGISKAEFLEEEAPNLYTWLHQGKHGKMLYMENHFDKRLDPTKLVPGAKSVITLAYNYFTEEQQATDAPKISKYAYGKDYHIVIKDKLRLFFETLKEQIGAIEGRVFVDSAPVLEKAWAKKSGVGWVGKNTNIINPKAGSYFFLAEVISDLELIPDGPLKDYCGTCTRCLDACPTDAFYEPYKLDASKCISYVTIELKDEIIPNEFKGKMDNWMFGCDICQEVCPWNRFSKPHKEPLFNPHPELLNLTKNDWREITEDVFTAIFRQSAVKRTKFKGLTRNIKFLNDNL